jgi:hypothetical protein
MWPPPSCRPPVYPPARRRGRRNRRPRCASTRNRPLCVRGCRATARGGQGDLTLTPRDQPQSPRRPQDGSVGGFRGRVPRPPRKLARGTRTPPGGVRATPCRNPVTAAGRQFFCPAGGAVLHSSGRGAFAALQTRGASRGGAEVRRAYLLFGLLGGCLLGGSFVLGRMVWDPRRPDQGARGGGPGSLALLRAARSRARRKLLGRRPKAR